MKAKKGKVSVMTGNYAAANAARLCRPEVVSAYPITPQSEVAEQISAYVANGELDAEIVEVEGENSAMNVVCAASLAGARVFTATSSYGLVFMYDTLLQTAGYRAPVVMVNVNREPPGIQAVSGGQQDLISTRDSGWVQVIVENNQEIIDQIIMAYRLAEDHDIQLPVMVNYDGYYLSYLAESVEMPLIEDVDAFLAPLKSQPPRPRIIPGAATGCGTHGMEMGYVEARYKHWSALERAREKVDDIDRLFGEYFGRSYGGQIEEYRTDGADIIIVTSGSAAGTTRTVVDAKRNEGVRVGMVKIRLFRPFPEDRLTEVLKGRKAIGVVDRSLCFGWKCGPMCMEIKALTPDIGRMPILSYIDGLANLDITVPHITRVVDEVNGAAQGKPFQEVTWIPMEE
ncbi:MAG: pyruvate synthase subunit PorA [Chloroflexi bacterium RBG_16_60_22]|nr:MAG: pyruvate synthase subunit PorA [Chloroflexi bacterium RBG_16_60_22]